MDHNQCQDVAELAQLVSLCMFYTTQKLHRVFNTQSDILPALLLFVSDSVTPISRNIMAVNPSFSLPCISLDSLFLVGKLVS